MLEKINRIFKSKNKIYLGIIFATLLLYSLYSFLFLCKFFPQDTFDSQLAIFWDYTALHNLIPNKDIMYPYGFLFYYKNTSIFFSLIYISLFPTLAILTLLTFKKIIRNKILIYATFLSFIFFIFKYTGIEVFNRYGLLLGLSVLLSFVYDNYLHIPKRYSFLFGCLIGFVFSILNDVGLYMFSLFLLFSFFTPIFDRGFSIFKARSYCVYQVFTIVFFLSGILVGLIPITLFLIKLENLTIFIENSRYLIDFPIYAKTPFLPSLRSTENIFVFIITIATVFFLSYKRIVLKEKNNFFSYMSIGILISLFLLLQKSVIRSIDTQITFFGFLLYVFLVWETVGFLKSKIRPIFLHMYYFLALFLILYVIGLRGFSVTSTYFYKPVKLNLTTEKIQSFLVHKQTVCFSQNLLFYRENRTYKDVINFINSNTQGKKPLIFDYLTNPIFYVLRNQKSPFYFEVFASSSRYAQQQIIKEVNELDTDFVILNTNMLRVKDNVPDYARNSVLFKFILNNFSIYERVDNFIILKKTNNGLWENGNLDKILSFKKYLLNVDLESIPKSEGIYKNKTINKLKRIISSESISEINNFLVKNNINSDSKILVITPNLQINNKKIELAITTRDSETTVITFNKCDADKQCIINLSNMPLFYKNRVIKKMEMDKNFSGNIKILDGNAPNNLW